MGGMPYLSAQMATATLPKGEGKERMAFTGAASTKSISIVVERGERSCARTKDDGWGCHHSKEGSTCG